MPRPAHTTDRSTTAAFRMRESTKMILRSIQKRRGHPDLSDTLREAVDQYIQRELDASRAVA
jgi:hypothetical protein